ncbi:hypothetical protein D0N37_23455 [Pseudoalteromonas piscicida]|nr:hypothetical protein D0N37_23455 [Pseudoalteromonas piscicida]
MIFVDPYKYAVLIIKFRCKNDAFINFICIPYFFKTTFAVCIRQYFIFFFFFFFFFISSINFTVLRCRLLCYF